MAEEAVAFALIEEGEDDSLTVAVVVFVVLEEDVDAVVVVVLDGVTWGVEEELVVASSASCI